MKAERRHELQTNTLAQFINDLPIYLRIHANKVLMVVIIICAIILLVRYRMNATAAARAQARDALEGARNGIEQINRIEMVPDLAERVKQRRQMAQQVQMAVDQVLADTSEPEDNAVRAEAFIAQGDLYWAMANLSPLPGAATQPALAMPETPEQYLARAETAYNRVVKDYPGQYVARASALLGLAAIEENRRNWEKAIDTYNQMTADPTMPEVFKGLARQRIALMPQLRSPVHLGSFSSTQPTTAATTESTPAPTTQTVVPAVSGPASQPGT
jgi:hypothetical protein